jgi:hypothetical protein
MIINTSRHNDFLICLPLDLMKVSKKPHFSATIATMMMMMMMMMGRQVHKTTSSQSHNQEGGGRRT